MMQHGVGRPLKGNKVKQMQSLIKFDGIFDLSVWSACLQRPRSTKISRLEVDS
jgi:hypothetical protein